MPRCAAVVCAAPLIIPSMNEHRTPEEQQALDAQYMALALEEARAAGAAGEVPIGAVVVYEPIDRGTRRPLAEPRVIARGRNRREADRDPAGHAEFLAMKEAARVLDAWRLTDCTVYVTLEPCIMCAGLMHQARIARCVYGAPDQKAGAVGTLYDIHADGRLNHQFEVTGGVREEECVALLRGFFFLVPSFFFLPKILHIDGIWLALALSEISTTICIILFYLYCRRNDRKTE